MSSAPIEDFYAVIPAGGAGTRLWPVSRRAEPKFLKDLTGSGRSLLQATCDRLASQTEGRILVVTGTAHREAVVEQLAGRDGATVLAEPSPRDSMAAIGLAAAVLERRDPQAVMGSFAADHVIADDAAFGEAVATAVAAARSGWLVTIGIEPTSPSSAFGYVRVGEELPRTPGAHRVEAFVEKPSRAVATAYLATGGYRWNAGMFVVRPGVLLDLLGRWHPQFARDLRAIAADDDGLEERLRAGWAALPSIAVDHAVAEPAAVAGEVAVVPAAFGWDDVGDFDALAEVLGPGPQGVAVLGDADLVHAVGSSGLVVTGGDRVVALVAVEDVVVVDTPDALLVTTRDRAQDVREVLARVREAGRDDLT